MNVRIKKLHPNAVIPSYANDGDAGMDLIATEIIYETHTQITYGTGIALEIPEGFVGLVFPRSSIRNKGLQLSNSVGLIDCGYRGEIQATFNKTHFLETHFLGIGAEKYNINDRIVQIMIIPYPLIEFEVVDTLSNTERGEGGFGSTGN